MKIQGTYKITYLNRGISQTKNLISHVDYIEDVKPSYIQIDEFERSKKTEHLANGIKSRLKREYGSEWFTDRSPLYDAIQTRLLEVFGGGVSPIEIVKINQL